MAKQKPEKEVHNHNNVAKMCHFALMTGLNRPTQVTFQREKHPSLIYILPPSSFEKIKANPVRSLAVSCLRTKAAFKIHGSKKNWRRKSFELGSAV